MSAAQMQLLTAGMTSKERTALKKMMLRPGFVAEWNSLDAMAAGFAKALLAEENSAPSASYRLFTSYDPEAVLWLGFTSEDPRVLERFNLFLKVWPEARQRIPYALMQELRITPELAAHREIVQSLFMELIDGRLTAPEEFRAFLEPHSPPAPPPKEVTKRPRAKRGAETRLKEHSVDDEDSEDGLEDDEDLDDLVGEEDDLDLGLSLPKVDLETEIPDLIASDLIEPDAAESGEDELDAEEPESVVVAAKRDSKMPAPPKPAKEAPVPAPVNADQPAAAVPAAKPIAPKAEKTEKPRPAAKPKPEAKPKQTKAAAAAVVKAAAAAKAAGKESKAAKPASAASAAVSKGAARSPKGSQVKSTPAKGGSTPAAAAKRGKAPQPAKPSKAVVRKPASKPARKR
jgi:hypothetical protein